MASSILPDVYKSHPVHLQHKQDDFTSLVELPDSYKWSNQDCHSSSSGETVPVIDLQDPNAINLIGHACKTWGVFQITNHGISSGLLNDVEMTNKNLFSLPRNEKDKAARLPNGISGYGMARISCFFSKIMWSEGFTIVGSPLEHFRKLWPLEHKKYSQIMEEYNKEMKNLSKKLLWLILDSLEVTKRDINWAGSNGELNEASSAIQLNHYPVCPDPDQAMGLAAHTDSTLLTILHQNNTSGLQVLKDECGWVTVPPLSGGLVVHVGDLIQILTNGQYNSVVHRAMVNRIYPRRSIAFLYGPPARAQISPIPKLTGPANPPLYRAVTWQEFLHTKAKHFNAAFSKIKL